MRICRVCLAIIVVAGSLCISFGQSGVDPSTRTPKPNDAKSAKVAQPKSESPSMPSSFVVPAAYPKTFDAKTTQAKSEPLLQPGSARECQVSLSLKWIEFRDDPNIVEVKKLHDLLAADQAADPNLDTDQTTEILALTDQLLKQRLAKTLADDKVILANGRSEQIYHGALFDRTATTKAGKLKYVAKSENGSFSSAESDLLGRPHIQFVGTTILATAEVQDENRIGVKTIARITSLAPEDSIRGVPGVTTRVFNSNIELNNGQSFVVHGGTTIRTTMNVQRIPVLGEIPSIGPRLFSKKTMINEQVQDLCIVTPEIIKPSDETPKPRRPENE